MQTTTPMLSKPMGTLDVNAYRDQLARVLGSTTISSATPKTTSVVTPTTVATPVVTTPVAKAPVVATPVTTTTGGYSVKAGDSLSKIAQSNGMSLAQLLDLNPTYKANPNLVQVGASLNLTGGSNLASVVTTPATTPTSSTPTQTPEQKAQADAQALAEKAGKAGYTPEQYQKVVETNNTVTQAESDAIAKELGIPTVEGELFKKPSQTSQQLYQTAYETSGLADLKKKIQDINDLITKDRAQLTEAIGVIDENPFLTESSRVGRGKRLLDQAEQKINNRLAQAKQYQDLYDGGITEINNMVTRNQNDFNTDQTINTAKLNYLQKKAEQQTGILKDTKIKTGSNLDSYLTGSATTKKPDVIGNSESGFFKYDSTTGKFIQVVSPSAKTVAETRKANADAENGGTGNTFKPTAEQKSLVGRFVNSTASKELNFTEADKARLNTDPNFFYWALQKANEAGIY